MKKVWAVDIIESERGWGQKVDETLYFHKKEDAQKYMEDYNKEYNNLPYVPDWYMTAWYPRCMEIPDTDEIR